MPSTEYWRYIRSDKWQAVRLRVLSRARGHCEACGRVCGLPIEHSVHDFCEVPLDERCDWCREHTDQDGYRNDTRIEFLEIHHRTYDRLGHEDLDDLLALCPSCHEGITDRTWHLRGMADAGMISRKDANPIRAERGFGRFVLESMVNFFRGRK